MVIVILRPTRPVLKLIYHRLWLSIMIPEALFGIYQRYKQDTTHVTTWLSKAAITCGSDPASFTKQTVTSVQPSIENEAQRDSKTPKLKGRARKLAREAAATKAKEQEPAQGCQADGKTKRYAVSSRDLLVQAKVVATSRNPSIDVPETVVCVLQRAIDARRRCLLWFEKRSGKDETSNQSHAKFVDILEQVHSALVSSSTTQASSKHLGGKSKEENEPGRPTKLPQKGKQSTSSTLKNRFDALQIEESTFADNVPPTADAPPREVGKNLANALFELEPPKEENTEFELFCFTQDMIEVQHLYGVWKRYQERNTDLITATVVTVAAIQGIKELEEDFVQRCPLFSENRTCHFAALFSAYCSVSESQPEIVPNIMENRD